VRAWLFMPVPVCVFGMWFEKRGAIERGIWWLNVSNKSGAVSDARPIRLLARRQTVRGVSLPFLCEFSITNVDLDVYDNYSTVSPETLSLQHTAWPSASIGASG
jgi:hypothetical protein